MLSLTFPVQIDKVQLHSRHFFAGRLLRLTEPPAPITASASALTSCAPVLVSPPDPCIWRALTAGRKPGREAAASTGRCELAAGAGARTALWPAGSCTCARPELMPARNAAVIITLVRACAFCLALAVRRSARVAQCMLANNCCDESRGVFGRTYR